MTTQSFLPPNNAQAEEATLGALLLDPHWAIPQVQPLLKGPEFYLQKHHWLYAVLLDLHACNVPVDLLTVTTELQKREQLEGLGGAAYVSSLIEAVPSAVHVVSYAREVHQTFIRRRVLEACTAAARLAYDMQLPIEKVADQAEALFLNIRDGLSHEDRLQPFDRILSQLHQEAEALYLNGVPLGVPTGIKQLDHLLGGGLRKGTLNIVAARPGVGKSVLLATFAIHALRHHVPAAIFSIEMRGLEVAGRIIQKELGLDYTRLKEEDWPRFTDGIGTLADYPLWIDDSPRLAIEDLRTKVRRLYANHGLGLVLLDYVQLATTNQAMESRYLTIGHITRELKQLAQELQIPVVAASQLGRSADHHRPTMGDLRESGNQESDADVVLLLHRPHEIDNAPLVETEFLLPKHRQGETGCFTMFFHKAQLRFVPLKEDEIG
jgi:replicative DNA helicase